MCVIEEKTYRQSDGTYKTIPVLSPCHRYISLEKCDFTEYRGSGNESPRFVEIRPSTSAATTGRPGSSSSSSERVERILVDAKGRHRRYVTVVRRSANQASSSARATAGGASPAPPSPRGILKQTHSRNVSDSEASGISSTGYTTRMVEPDSAGSSARPSSMGSYTDLFDPSQSRRGSPRYESTVEDDGFLHPPRRTTSVRVVQEKTTKTTSETRETRRPPPIDTGAGSSRPRTTGHARSDSASDLPLRVSTKGKERETEVRFVAVDEMESEEDRQSRLERERLANTDRRQQGREQRVAAENDVAARQARMERDARERILNAEAHQRQTSEQAQQAAADRARQRAQRNAAQSARSEREHQEQREQERRQKILSDRAEYEREQMRREKEEYEHRLRGEFYGDSPLGSPTLSHATVSPTPSASRPALLPVPPPAFGPSSPVGSYGSPTYSARTPSGTTVQTVVHNPRREGRANTYDRGARVLAEEQQRAAMREMESDMAAMRFDEPSGPAEPNQGRRRDDRGRQQYYQ